MESSRKHVPSLCGCSHQTQGVCCQGGGGGFIRERDMAVLYLQQGKEAGFASRAPSPGKGGCAARPWSSWQARLLQGCI